MLSANSSRKEIPERPLRDIRHVFKRELRAHGNWLFIFCALFLLAEPFLFYLLGLNLNIKYGYGEAEYLPMKAVLKADHLFLIAPLTILAAAFLALKLFSFLRDKGQLDMVLSWPHSRSSLYFGKLAAGFFLMLIPFILNALGTAVVLPGQLTLYLKEAGRLVLSALALVASFSLVSFLRGKLFHSLALAILIQFVVPVTMFLGGAYAIDSIPGLFSERLPDWYRGPAGSVMLVLSPALQLFDTRQDLYVWILRVLSLVLYVAIGWLLFNTRRAEIAGQNPNPARGVSISETFWLLMSGMLGAFFFEAIASQRSFFIALIGFAVFAILAAFLLNQLKFKQTLPRRALRYAAIALFIFTIFNLVCELYPSRDAREWKAEELKALEIELRPYAFRYEIDYGIYERDFPVMPMSLRLDGEEDAELIRRFLDAPVKESSPVKRDGLIRQGVKGYWEDEISYNQKQIKLFHQDGRVSYLAIAIPGEDDDYTLSNQVDQMIYEWVEEEPEFRFLLHSLEEMERIKEMELTYHYVDEGASNKFLELLRAHEDFELVAYSPSLRANLSSDSSVTISVKGESRERIFAELKKRGNIRPGEAISPPIRRHSDEYIAKENALFGLSPYSSLEIRLLPEKEDIYFPEQYIRGNDFGEIRAQVENYGYRVEVMPRNKFAETWNLIFELLRENDAEGGQE